jgi:hypothetical protein
MERSSCQQFLSLVGPAYSWLKAILLPGPYRRSDAIKIYGLQASKLLFGLIPMLVIAGIIEGFFSPQTWIPNVLKYVVGTALLVGLIQYCRSQRPASL